jgi:hypothetical protein
MQLLMKYEVIAFFILPFVLAVLQRRDVITRKQVSFTISTHLSLIIGTYYLSLGKPESLFSLPLVDWSVALVLSLFCWIFTYAFSRWLSGQWSQK